MKTTDPDAEPWARSKIVEFRRLQEEESESSIDHGCMAIGVLLFGFVLELFVHGLEWTQDSALGLLVFAAAGTAFLQFLRSVRSGINAWQYGVGIRNLEAGLKRKNKSNTNT